MLQGLRARLSQDLVGLWADEYGPALALLRRVLPPGLMRYLNVRQEQPAQAQVGVACLAACTLRTLSRPSGNVCTLATMLCNITARSSSHDSWQHFVALLCLQICMNTFFNMLKWWHGLLGPVHTPLTVSSDLWTVCVYVFMPVLQRPLMSISNSPSLPAPLPQQLPSPTTQRKYFLAGD